MQTRNAQRHNIPLHSQYSPSSVIAPLRAPFFCLFGSLFIPFSTNENNYVKILNQLAMTIRNKQYKKPSSEKKFAPNVRSFNSIQIIKWCSNNNSHHPPRWFLFVQNRRPTSRRMGVVIGEPLSDLITIELPTFGSSNQSTPFCSNQY